MLSYLIAACSGREILDTPENDPDGGKAYYEAIDQLNKLGAEMRKKGQKAKAHATGVDKRAPRVR